MFRASTRKHSGFLCHIVLCFFTIIRFTSRFSTAAHYQCTVNDNTKNVLTGRSLWFACICFGHKKSTVWLIVSCEQRDRVLIGRQTIFWKHDFLMKFLFTLCRQTDFFRVFYAPRIYCRYRDRHRIAVHNNRTTFLESLFLYVSDVGGFLP